MLLLSRLNYMSKEIRRAMNNLFNCQWQCLICRVSWMHREEQRHPLPSLETSRWKGGTEDRYPCCSRRLGYQTAQWWALFCYWALALTLWGKRIPSKMCLRPDVVCDLHSRLQELLLTNDTLWTHLTSVSCLNSLAKVTWLKHVFGLVTSGLLYFLRQRSSIPQSGPMSRSESVTNSLNVAPSVPRHHFYEPVGGSRNTLFPFRCSLRREKRGKWGV